MEQQPLISVIIPEFEDDTYLMRCINSIRRQTYKNVEILLIRDTISQEVEDISNLRTLYYGNYWENLNFAIAQASGSAIFFCHTNTVLESQLLEKLVGLNDEKTFCYARCLKTNGKNFENINYNELTLYGKLFYLKFITDKTRCFNFERYFPEFSFLHSYTRNFNEIVLSNNCYIYGESEDIYNIISNDIMLFPEAEREIPLLNSDNPIDRAAIFYMIDHAPKNMASEEWLELAVKLENKFHNYRINYEIADKYLCEIFRTCLKENDFQLFESFKKYFTAFRENKYYLKVICSLFGIKEIDLLLSSSIDEYLFYKDKMIDIDTKAEAVLEEKVNVLNEKIKKLENIIKSSDVSKKQSDQSVAPITKEGNSSSMPLVGPEFAEYVISQYYQGKLGMRTIFKSVKGWIKYKF